MKPTKIFGYNILNWYLFVCPNMGRVVPHVFITHDPIAITVQVQPLPHPCYCDLVKTNHLGENNKMT